MKINKKLLKVYFFFTGLAALIWFLIRVIPKPSRASYPCMQAAFPIASGFVIYLASLIASVFAFNKLRKHWKEGKPRVAFSFLIIIIISGFFVLQSDSPFIYAHYKYFTEDPNQPIGSAKGIFPGRVVWVRDSSAVNQMCKNTAGDYWWQDINTNQSVVNKMVSQSLRELTGKKTDADAWDAIFRYYNLNHGRGDVGYTVGEKIVIKLNLNTGVSGDAYERSDNRTVDTSPQIIYAVLDQLVNIAGVAQADIGFGDPGRNVDNIFWNKFHQVFPGVKYWGNANGRTPITLSQKPELITSDGNMQLYLPECYLEATYMINIPVLKQHHRAGISLTSKNHFGSFVVSLGNAFPLHYSLPCTEGDGNVNNGRYGKYRIFVDFIGHKDLGGKTILYMIDGLWSSTNYGDPPWKWQTTPFNNSYPASIFVSQDPVAIESVGFDFLFNEFYVGNPSQNAFPCYAGVDDFLHQAADSANWPAGIHYDPENDGSYLPRSMGVHEHWNNSADKMYTRNLGTGSGIELDKISSVTSTNETGFMEMPDNFYLGNNYPNPFNPTTNFRFQISSASGGGLVTLKIFNELGKEVTTLINEDKEPGNYEIKFNASNLPSGIYYYRLTSGNYNGTKKMILLK